MGVNSSISGWPAAAISNKNSSSCHKEQTGNRLKLQFADGTESAVAQSLNILSKNETKSGITHGLNRGE
jgi:hypothetical protein